MIACASRSADVPKNNVIDSCVPVIVIGRCIPIHTDSHTNSYWFTYQIILIHILWRKPHNNYVIIWLHIIDRRRSRAHKWMEARGNTRCRPSANGPIRRIGSVYLCMRIYTVLVYSHIHKYTCAIFIQFVHAHVRFSYNLCTNTRFVYKYTICVCTNIQKIAHICTTSIHVRFLVVA
jgi:hypothetical protein